MNATETEYPITELLTLTEKKRIYVLWIEHLVRWGYSIDSHLSPNYSRKNFDYIVKSLINMGQSLDEQFTSQFLAYEDWYIKIQSKLGTE